MTQTEVEETLVDLTRQILALKKRVEEMENKDPVIDFTSHLICGKGNAISTDGRGINVTK